MPKDLNKKEQITRANATKRSFSTCSKYRYKYLTVNYPSIHNKKYNI